EEYLAMEDHLAGAKDGIVAGADGTYVVASWNVIGGEEGYDPRGRPHCGKIHAADPSMGLRCGSGIEVDCSWWAGDVVDATGLASRMLDRAVMGDGVMGDRGIWRLIHGPAPLSREPASGARAGRSRGRTSAKGSRRPGFDRPCSRANPRWR